MHPRQSNAIQVFVDPTIQVSGSVTSWYLRIKFLNSIAELWSYAASYYLCRFIVKMSSKDEHANKGPIILGISILVTFLAITAVALRFLSRKLSKAQYWWDDWMILAALVSPHF